MKTLKFFLLTLLGVNLSIAPAMAQSNSTVTNWQLIVGPIILILAVYFGMSFKTISGNTAFAVVSTFQEYTRIVGPGIHLLLWPIQEIEEIFPSTQVSIGVSQLVTAVRGETKDEYNIRTAGLSDEEKAKNPQFTQAGEIRIDSPTILIRFPKPDMVPDSQLIDIAEVWPSVPGEFASQEEKVKFQNELEGIFGDFLEDIFQEAVNGSWYSIYLNRQAIVNNMNTILENRVSSTQLPTRDQRDPIYLLSLIPHQLVQLTTGQLHIPEEYRKAIEKLGISSLEAAAKITQTEGDTTSLRMMINLMSTKQELALALRQLDIQEAAAKSGALNINQYNLDPVALKTLAEILLSKKS
jgi:regulator of protease activity HflC (stomatin/prohibitin superfamily)